MRAVFFDFGSVAEGGDLDPARLRVALPGIEIFDETREAELAPRLAGRAVAIANKVQFSDALMAVSPELKLIALTATGVNNVDLEAARRRGVAVCNIREYCTTSVVQHVFAALLALTHGLREYDRALKAGAWERAAQFTMLSHPIRELAGLTLGIVGYGTLGRGVARVAEAFGMRVLVANRAGGPREPGRLDLAELLPLVDVLTLHCPITPETHHLIGRAQLARMKPGAVLINTARGALVDAAALADALRARRLGGAAIDVLEQEPPVGGNPLLAPDLGNLLATPHTAWAARESRQRAIDEVAENVRDFLSGGRRNRVD
jgi:glycerate dehydrogenase